MYAIAATCSHLGGPLMKVIMKMVSCIALHKSGFRMVDVALLMPCRLCTAYFCCSCAQWQDRTPSSRTCLIALYARYLCSSLTFVANTIYVLATFLQSTSIPSTFMQSKR